MIPEPGHTSLSFSSFIILLGVVQGLVLGITGLLRSNQTDRYKAFLFLGITCIILEIFLNRTGYMYYAVQLVDFSEPLQFAVAPLMYFIVVSLDPAARIRRWWLHFIPFVLYLLYFLPFYLAPSDYKLESYYYTHHLVQWQSDRDFSFYYHWGWLRNYQLQITFLQTTIYLVLSFQLLRGYRKHPAQNAGVNLSEVNWWIIFCSIIALLIAVVLVVKTTFVRDLGDHIIASFFTLILYLATISELMHQGRSPMDSKKVNAEATPLRTSQGGIKEDKKAEIQQKLTTLMEQEKMFRDSLISLARVARQCGEPAYLVSQVINEKMGISFFDWIAQYRVYEARQLLTDPGKSSLTIEQIAEEVGYNSKSAFNKAFKKFTGKTPSEYKNT